MNYSDFRIERVTFRDKEDVLRISSQIWEGGDFIPEVFDIWVSDTNNHFLGLWNKARLVGFGRMKYLTANEVWLEGLRKDRTAEEKGVGECLTRKFLEIISKDENIRSVRFSTYFGNNESIAISRKLGFKKILTLSLKELTIGKDQNYSIAGNIVSNLKFSRVIEYIRLSGFSAGMKLFFSRGWVFHTFSDDLIREFNNSRKIICHQENGYIDGILIFDEVEYSDVLWISFLEAEEEKIYNDLLLYAEHIAGRMKKNKLQMVVPDLKKLLAVLEEYGFQSWEQNDDLLLFELSRETIKISQK